ncbi:hypothetical protein GCM10023185_03380 [Hymenobacter saemangeumensis]|uniref:PA14 domain-containing protein n=1 Tax=Hymenobacter saemangeumensis TaxID=1084522 RepID=A0ABP8HYZ8_9BACT
MKKATLRSILLLLLLSGIGHAQNLLTNPDFSAGNSGFASAYTYVLPTGSSQAGQSTIGPDSRAFNMGFPASYGDHTTGTGNYLIADGSTQGAVVWEQTVTGLTPNRDYTFSFWLLNAIAANKAQLQLSVNGTDAGPAFTNPSDGGQWQLNTVTLNTGSAGTLVLRLRNLTLASGGNDFGLDDLALYRQTNADVSTALTGPVTAGAGQVVGPFTAAFRNAGPGEANQVVQTVVLPAGASLTAAQVAALPSGATYAAATRTLHFGTAAVLPAGGANSFTFSFTAPPTTGVVALGSTVSTSSVQAPNAQPDQATLGLTVWPAAAPPAGCQPSYATGSPASGLSADYYAGYFADNLAFFSNTPALTRLEPQLRFADSYTDSPAGWGAIIPPATRASSSTSSPEHNNPELFSARYRGSIYLPAAGDYTFYLTSDDASYMWIDGAALAPTATNALINNGGLHGSLLRQATATLSAGLHNVLLYYGENGGGNTLELAYSAAGAAPFARQVVPNSQLCAGPSPLPPTALAVTQAPALLSTSARTALLPLAGTDPGQASGRAGAFVLATLPAAGSGTLYVGTQPATAGQLLSSAQAATLAFDPEPTFVGNATFTFYAASSNGQLSNLPATYTIPVVAPIADVGTTLSGPATLGGGISSGAYTVTFHNNGPQWATDVTQAVRLPAGSTMTPAQLAALPGTATYNAAAATITFETTSVLQSGSAITYTFGFTAPSTPGTAEVRSIVGTSTGQGSNAAPDQAVVNVTIAPGNFFVTNDDSNEVPGNGAKSGNVILNDANPANLANSAFTVQLVTGPSRGLVVVNANGSYTYTPNAGYLGPDSFTYRVNVPGANPPFSNISRVQLNVYDARLVCLSGTGTNLLANPSFTAGNTGFTSSYGYAGTGNRSLIPEGVYTVGSSAAAYHPNFAGNGRTGPGDSFMIVNGSQDLSVVYQQTVAVQPNRYYTFSAYAASVNPGSPAQLGFVINGRSTSSVTTLPTTVNTYVRLSDLWFSGSQTSAVVEIRDVNKDVGGNDFGIDDLYVGTCVVTLIANDVTNSRLSDQAPATPLSALQATVISGPPVGTFTIRTLPGAAAGVLYLNNSPVFPGQVIPLAQANRLVFAPRYGYAGNAVFTYTATDTSGAGSNNTATFTIPIGNPLPVELTRFSAKPVQDLDAQLTWHTALELDNKHFDVERSLNGTEFIKIAQVLGQGSTTAATIYAFTDAGIGARARGTVYYRLRQVDTDGTASYSPVRTVVFAGPATLAFYPNPSAGEATLDLSALPRAEYQVTMVDALGRQVLSTSLPGAQAHPMLLGHLPRGTYLLLVRGAGRKLSQRVVRE